MNKSDLTRLSDRIDLSLVNADVGSIPWTVTDLPALGPILGIRLSPVTRGGGVSDPVIEVEESVTPNASARDDEELEWCSREAKALLTRSVSVL